MLKMAGGVGATMRPPVGPGQSPGGESPWKLMDSDDF